MALKIKVGPIGLLDMLKFKQQANVRRKTIAKTPSTPLPKVYNTNAKAEILHPSYQLVTVTEIEQHGADVKTYILSVKSGKAAYFRAGQYLSVELKIGNSILTRPYSICSSPELALKQNKYAITVKRAGFASSFILDNWSIGSEVKVSAPLGQFYYEGIRDSSHVIAVAGGSGITPFLSMAYAVSSGREDFDLTVLYGSRRKSDILFAAEFAQIAIKTPRVRLINVLSDEDAQGCEHGFVTAELIKKYAGDSEYSLYICGPAAMYKFLEGETAKLGIPQKFIRRELFGITAEPWTVAGYPVEAKDKSFKLTVSCCGTERFLNCNANEPILVALERAGIAAPSHCRSGECGYCHSRLVSGEVFIPENVDGRRAADKVYGYFHPCCSFPLSDIVMELPPNK